MALFDVTVDARDGAARAIRFDTAPGQVHTAMFMPVGTHATVPGVPHMKRMKIYRR